jgi:hypothetical protein
MAMQSMKFQSTTSMKGGGNKATNIAKWKNSLVVIDTIQVTNKHHHRRRRRCCRRRRRNPNHQLQLVTGNTATTIAR